MIPKVDCDNGRFVVLVNDERQSVLQDECFVGYVDSDILDGIRRIGESRPEQRHAKCANSRKDFGILQGTQLHVLPVRPNPTSSQAEVVVSGEWTRLVNWGI